MNKAKELPAFLRRAETAFNDMNITDRKMLAAILEDLSRRVEQLEKDTDPHRER